MTRRRYDGGDSKHLRNVVQYLSEHTAQYPKTQQLAFKCKSVSMTSNHQHTRYKAQHSHHIQKTSFHLNGHRINMLELAN
jgi:hypothetical protein